MYVCRWDWGSAFEMQLKWWCLRAKTPDRNVGVLKNSTISTDEEPPPPLPRAFIRTGARGARGPTLRFWNDCLQSWYNPSQGSINFQNKSLSRMGVNGFRIFYWKLAWYLSPDESVSRKNFNTCPLTSLTWSLAAHSDISSRKFSLFYDWTSFDLRNDQYNIIKGLKQFCVDHFVGQLHGIQNER